MIGDLPTPVKYFNPQINLSYGQIEDVAKAKLLSFLPEELSAEYKKFFYPDEDTYEYKLCLLYTSNQTVPAWES